MQNLTNGRLDRGTECRRDAGGPMEGRAEAVSGPAKLTRFRLQRGADRLRDQIELCGEFGSAVDHRGDHNAAASKAGSVMVDARRRAKPAGVARRYGSSAVLTSSLMSFCEKVTVSPPPKAFATSPMRLRSR